MDNMRMFYRIWAGQTLSALGSSVQAFALGIWVYQSTGAIMDFGLALLCSLLPQVVLGPFAGVFVDRWPRRRIMMLCDAGAALSALILLVLSERAQLQVHHVYVISFATAILACFHKLAYSAIVTPLLPDAKQRARANGLIQFGLAAAAVVGPLLAGLLLGWVGLSGVIAVDAITFVIALLSLIPLRFPDLIPTANEQKTFWGDFRQGIAFIRGRSDLRVLLLVVAICNFSVGFMQTLFTPMVLTVSTHATLGFLVSLGGVGMLVGGAAASLWPMPGRAIAAVWMGLLLCAACLTLGGLRANIVLWGAVTFLFFVAIPVINVRLQDIWQHQVAASLQGRVFAVRYMIATASMPFAYLLAPWLATHCFEPWLLPDGALASTAGLVFGTGVGRGMGMMFSMMGALLFTLAVSLAMNRKLKHLDAQALREADAPLGNSTPA